MLARGRLIGELGRADASVERILRLVFISNAFSLADINPYYQDIVKGCIIVGALAFDVYARRLAGRARAAPSG